MNSLNNNENTVFNINQVANYLGCSVQTIRTRIKEGEIPTYQIGRKYLFRKSKIDEWIAEKELSYKQNLREKDIQQTIKKFTE